MTIPNGVTYIGDCAFSVCDSLTSVAIPISVTYIGDSAFTFCSRLTSINTVSGNSNYVSVDGVLFNTDRTLLHTYPSGKRGLSYRIPSSVTSIGKHAFEGCERLTSVIIPDSVTFIGDYAFYECYGLTSVTIPSSVTSIGYMAFYGCRCLTDVTIPNSVTSIEKYAFAYCTCLTSVTIPDSITTIKGFTFWGCGSLTNVTIPDSVTFIGEDAFVYCSSLTNVIIPNSVTTIKYRAFKDCHALKDVYYGGSEEQWKQVTVDKNGNELLINATIHCNSLTKTELERKSDDLLRSFDDEKNAQSRTTENNSRPANSIQETQGIKSNNLDPDLDNIITLNDQEGNSVQFAFLDLVEYQGKEYVVLLPTSEDSEDDSASAVIILEVINTGKDVDSYVTINNEEDLQAVFNIFKERFKEEFNFVD